MISAFLCKGLKQLLVRNLDVNVKPHIVKQTFETVGVIKEFQLEYDEDNMCNKGFAFIEYSDPANCEKARQAFDNKKVYTKVIRALVVQNDKEDSVLDGEKLSPRTEFVNYEREIEPIAEL